MDLKVTRLESLQTALFVVWEFPSGSGEPLVSILRGAGLRYQRFARRYELLEHLKRRSAECVVLCSDRTDEVCQDLIGEIDRYQDAPAIVLRCLSYTGPEIVEAFRRGLSDALLPTDDAIAVLAALERAVAAARRRRRFRVLHDEAQSRLRRLNVMQRDVLDHLADGKTARAIARSLHRSQKTIEYHRARIMLKLRAESLADVVRMVVIARELADWEQPQGVPGGTGNSTSDTIEIEARGMDKVVRDPARAITPDARPP